MTGSAARQAFARARERLRAYRPEDAFLAPAVSYRVEAGSPPPAAAGGAAPNGPPTWPRAGAAEALVRSALAAVERHQGTLNAFAHVDADGALAAARARDRERAAGRVRGPLHGIPVSVKDVIDVVGMPTRAGCDGFCRHPAADAAAVARVRAAGAVILGKTITHQFAMGVTTPQSRNPHDATRVPGGSSGGSAIAVATGMGLASLGTDTRASIRVPAALTGVVGFKPTFGAVPTDGVVTMSWSMDHVGPLAATVAGAALVLDVLLGRSISPAVGADVAGWTIGVPEAGLEGADPAARAAMEAALAVLREAGCAVVPLDRPTAADLDDANAAGLVISRCEAAAIHAHLDVDPGAYWHEVAAQLDEGRRTPAAMYLDAQRLRTELTERLRRALTRVHALAMPATPVPAPPVAGSDQDLTVLSRNAIPWSLAGFPALSVPAGRTSEGLPLGLQLAAAPGGEACLAALGGAVERGLAASA